MRVISWNCRRAKAASPVWEYLLSKEPDIFLLQEVTSFPDLFLLQFDLRFLKAVYKNEKSQSFGSLIGIKGRIEDSLVLSSSVPWLDQEIDRFKQNLPAFILHHEKGQTFKGVSVYSPAWPVPRERWEGRDVKGIKLDQNNDLWVTDLLLAGIKNNQDLSNGSWIIGGDYNMSETFDEWKGGPRGNREYLDRMAGLGLVECLRTFQGKLTPTFKNTSGGAVRNQMDHLFVSRKLADRLVSCETGTLEDIFDKNLSDHLPIIAEFDL